MNKIKATTVILLGSLVFGPAVADEFDGSVPLICATVEARDCVLGSDCYTGNPDDLGAPRFIRIDFKKKVLKGTEISSPILNMTKQKNQLIMQGSELDFGWTFSLNQSNGKFSASLTNPDGAFLLFGSCMPL